MEVTYSGDQAIDRAPDVWVDDLHVITYSEELLIHG